MRWSLAWLLVVGTVAGADESAAVKKDRDALQGLWQAVALVGNGQPAPEQVVQMFQVRFKGDKIYFNPKTENREHTFRLDPDAKPKAMDLTPSDGPAKGKTLPCAIYKLEGDRLTICLEKEPKTGARPTEFKSPPGAGIALLTLERVKE